MSYRHILCHCILTLLLFLGGLLPGCAPRSEPQKTPLPTAKLSLVTNDGSMLFTNTHAADQLAANLAGRMEPAYGILSTSLIEMDDLTKVPHYGHMLMQQVSSRLTQHGFKIIEARLGSIMVINKQGEFMLSREIGTRLSKEYSVHAVLVGLYSKVGDRQYISLRVLRLGDSAVLAAYEYSLAQSMLTPTAAIYHPGTATVAASAYSSAAPVQTSSTPYFAAAPKSAAVTMLPATAPAPVTAKASPCDSSATAGENALWEKYSKRGQAFARCPGTSSTPLAAPASAYSASKQSAPKASASKASSYRAGAKAGHASKTTPKSGQLAPDPKTDIDLKNLLGKDPLCPPGCVPSDEAAASAAPAQAPMPFPTATPQPAATPESVTTLFPTAIPPIITAPLSTEAPMPDKGADRLPLLSEPTPSAENDTGLPLAPAVGIPAPTASQLGQMGQPQTR